MAHTPKNSSVTTSRVAQGPRTDLALHTLGWKSFQDLCAHVCEEVFKCPVEIFREAQDGGQDAVFISKSDTQNPVTVQCKSSSKAEQKLKTTDIGEEFQHIAELKKKGQAETYIFMTSMSVDAPVAIEVKKRLRSLGVVKAHVYGKEYLTRVIRSNAKLRALVPRVYGLGDLSIILDERAAEQTKALLGHMNSTLKVYVTTEPHVQAIKALTKHGIVLLTGNPATGKSTIAAILATIAAEDPNHVCYKADGPIELIKNWNPNEPGGFYWIDDAFGPNQMRSDFVDHWIQIFPKIITAIANGNQFVLTSRRHIYEAAKMKLGSRNHPRFTDNQAIVHVGTLKPEERLQILYNHIKAGGQPTQWKKRIKPYLDSLANEESFLPEIARRFADPAYTTQLKFTADALIDFFQNPLEYLVGTISELSNENRAALVLIYLHRGAIQNGDIDSEIEHLVIQHYGVAPDFLRQALEQLKDSFLVDRMENKTRILTFKHPTIADAISRILSTQGTIEFYLRGARPSSILNETVCVSAPIVKNAIILTEECNQLLADRIAELPDEEAINKLLFTYLCERTSDKAFKTILEKTPSILTRKGQSYWSAGFDGKTRTCARAKNMDLLPDEIHYEIKEYLKYRLFNEADTSFLDDDQILALFTPSELLKLPAQIRTETVENIISTASSIAEDPDLDREPQDNFEDVQSSVSSLEDLFKDDQAMLDALSGANDAIGEAIENVREQREERHRPQEASWDWEVDQNDHYYRNKATTTAKTATIGMPKGMERIGVRSIFSDVEE